MGCGAAKPEEEQQRAPGSPRPGEPAPVRAASGSNISPATETPPRGSTAVRSSVIYNRTEGTEENSSYTAGAHTTTGSVAALPGSSPSNVSLSGMPFGFTQQTPHHTFTDSTGRKVTSAFTNKNKVEGVVRWIDAVVRARPNGAAASPSTMAGAATSNSGSQLSGIYDSTTPRALLSCFSGPLSWPNPQNDALKEKPVAPPPQSPHSQSQVTTGLSGATGETSSTGDGNFTMSESFAARPSGVGGGAATPSAPALPQQRSSAMLNSSIPLLPPPGTINVTGPAAGERPSSSAHLGVNATLGLLLSPSSATVIGTPNTSAFEPVGASMRNNAPTPRGFSGTTSTTLGASSYMGESSYVGSPQIGDRDRAVADHSGVHAHDSGTMAPQPSNTGNGGAEDDGAKAATAEIPSPPGARALEPRAEGAATAQAPA